MPTLTQLVPPSSFGSIGPNFGSTNLDSIPSSGGTAGYTSQLSIPTPTPTRYYPTSDGGYSITPPSLQGGSSVNAVQSGTVDPTFEELLQLYGSQFGGPSDASTSGTGVVVVPQQTSSGGGSSVSPQLLALAGIGVVAFLGYRWYKGRA